MASKQRKAADDFSGTFADEILRKWEKMVEEWQEDHSRTNPYIFNERGMFFFWSV